MRKYPESQSFEAAQRQIDLRQMVVLGAVGTLIVLAWAIVQVVRVMV